MEIKIIPNTNGRYGASRDGRIYSFYNNKGNLRAHPIELQQTNKRGYKQVHIRVNGVKSHYRVHRLIAETFLQNPNNLPQVNHKNEIKTDNRVENLEWCTAAYNIVYSKNKNNRGKTLVQYSTNGKIVQVFSSQKEAAKFLYCSNGKISRMLSGEIKNEYNLQYTVIP